jgi:benzylsuccinate CoA-transferase BbsF subunit
MALPLTGRILAALGAEVIKIETTTRPDPTNYLPPWAPGSGRPEYDTSKRRITLEVGHPEAPPVTLKLLSKADVFATNFRRDVLKKWGIDFPDIRKVNPDIIILWQTGTGSVGPYSNYKFFGYPSQYATGVSLMTGFPQDALQATSTSYSDYHCGVFNPLVIISALLKRKRTGKASTIECSIWKSGLVTVGPALLDFQANGRFPERRGNHDLHACPHSLYPCKGQDRWCAITVSTEKEWLALCKVMGNRDLAKEPRFATLVCRMENADELDKLIGKWTINYAATEVMDMLQKAGVPAGIVAKGQDLYESPQLRARDYYHQAKYFSSDVTKPGTQWPAGSRPAITARVPIGLSATPCQFTDYKRMGEDNDYVYKEVIGLSDEEFNNLIKSGVIR